MNKNEKMTETEKFLKEMEMVREKLEESFDELQDSLQKIFACEFKKPLLKEKEHSYLSSIIKPFRNKVTYIGKFTKGEDENYIEIGIYEDLDIGLPVFPSNQMYLGMQEDKKYTLEELGL